MKTVVETRDLERSTDFHESTFKIKASGKAFKILSDGLYSDKIKAIIRELSCNAYDAHIEAGTEDTQFDVHLPTTFEPTFYIRDYGTGLSKEDIETVYTTYFESTKTDSNDAIGCLGLGSKSPFSYVDMFTVTSVLDGMQFVYSALINEQGTPAIMLINESETEESNGLKIQFAVKREDMSEFSYKAKEVFFYFQNKPNILGNTIDIETCSYTVKSEVWGLTDSRSGQAVAIMGNVAYPISLNKVDFSEEERTIIQNFPVDLFFKIGDLEVAASREGLSYDERTTKAIRSRIKDIIDHEKARIETDLKKQASYWDAVIWLRKEKEGNKVVDLLFRNSTLEYKGRVIKEYFDVPKKEYFEVLALAADEDEEYEDNFSVTVVSYKEKWSRKTYGHHKTVGKPDRTWRVAIQDKVAIFNNDCPRGHMVRVKAFLAQNEDIGTVYLVKSTDPELVTRFIDDLGFIGLKTLSDVVVPKVDRKKRNNSAVGHFVKFNWEAHEHSETPRFWDTIKDEEDFDLDDGGFYVPINRWKTIYKDSEDAPRELLYKLNTLHKVASPSDPMPIIYGIKKAKLSLVEDKDNWISWIDYVQEIVRQYALSAKVSAQLETICNNKGVNYGQVGRLFRLIQHQDEFKNTQDKEKIVGSQWMEECDSSLLSTLAEGYDIMNSSSSVDHNGAVRFLWGFIQSGRSTISEADVKKFHNYAEKHDALMHDFYETYPLLKDCYASFGNAVGIRHILHYVNAITEYNKATQS